MHCVKSLLSHVKLKSYSKYITLQQVPRHNLIIDHLFCKYSQYQQVTPEEDEPDKIVSELCVNAEEEKKLRILMLEVEVMRQDGRCAPSHLRKNHWKNLLELASKNQRVNYLTYLWKTQKAKENVKAKKEKRRIEKETYVPEHTKEFPDDLLYGIQYQSLFLRIRDQSINNFDNYKALQASMYGLPVIIDCSYENDMVKREALNAAKQVTFVFGDNRIHKDPFDIHLCNVNHEGEFMKQLRKNIPSVLDPDFPIHLHTQSYLDIFPKNKLVYLTPHCREELTEYDYDAIYIIGCMVDKINNEPLSLAKAKRDGIKMAKLPLDRYMEWAPGSNKNLNINHMVPILLDLKTSCDWEFSLRHVPRRKLMETKILAINKKYGDNPKLRDNILRSFTPAGKFSSKSDFPSYKQKRNTSRKSLYDDDSI